MRTRSLLLILTLALPAFAGGTLTEKVAAKNDPSQTYTLYLPSQYDGKAHLPLLFVLDPRGRGTLAAGIFREAAEENGWIVISADGTRSDEGWEPNDSAMRALGPELSRYGADRKRIYAAGFSGTAMYAWAMASRSTTFAGVIGVGGRLIDAVSPAQFGFASYGFAGENDFNNTDMRKIDEILERGAKVHRFRQFQGGHEWITPALARDAVRWMEIVAMQDGRRKRDDAMIAASFDADLRSAADDEKNGRMLDALRLHQSIVRTYAGLHDTALASDAIARLDAAPATVAERAQVAEWDDFEHRFTVAVFERTGAIFGELRAKRSESPGAVAREYRVRELQKRSTVPGYEGTAARRLLESMYAQMSFYLPREFDARKEYGFSAAALGVATMLHPEHPGVWYSLGAAHAHNGDRKHALEALEKAFAAGFDDRARLQADEAFASLRAEPRFIALATAK